MILFPLLFQKIVTFPGLIFHKRSVIYESGFQSGEPGSWKYNLQTRLPESLMRETVLATRERFTDRRGCNSPFIRAKLHLTYRNTTWVKLAILKRYTEGAQHICK